MVTLSLELLLGIVLALAGGAFLVARLIYANRVATAESLLAVLGNLADPAKILAYQELIAKAEAKLEATEKQLTDTKADAAEERQRLKVEATVLRAELTIASQATAETSRTAAEHRRFTDTVGGQTSTLRAGLRIVGQLSSPNSVDLGGFLKGDSKIEGLFRVRDTASVEGSIAADMVIIEGEVTGDRIFARRKITLGPRARVSADLDTASLALGEGSILDGLVHMREGGAGAVFFQDKRLRDPARALEAMRRPHSPTAAHPRRGGGPSRFTSSS